MSANVLRGRPLPVRAEGRRAALADRDTLNCNMNPRVSLAGALTVGELRDAQSAPGVPGRVPAPRAELSCRDADPPEGVVSGVFASFARGSSPLPPSRPGGPPANPPIVSGTPPAPPPTLNPGPIVPPVEGGPRPPGPPLGPCGCDGPSEVPTMRGQPRVIVFPLTGTTSGGVADAEVRVSPLLPRPFLIREVQLVPVTGTALGQFVDVLVSGDSELVDTASPTGVSIFDQIQVASDTPAEDVFRGLPVTSEAYDISTPFWVPEESRTIKVVSRFQAPAVSLPVLHVIVVLDEFDAAPMPIVPRPPIVAAPPPPPPPTPDAPGPVPPTYPPPVPPVTAPPVVVPEDYLRVRILRKKDGRVVRVASDKVCDPGVFQGFNTVCVRRSIAESIKRFNP